MDSIVAFLETMTLWHWIGVGIVLLTIEVAVGTFDLLWIAVGAFLTALFAFLAPEGMAGWQGQLVFFGVVAVALIIMGRTVFRGMRQVVSSHPNLNDRMSTMVGKSGEAVETFERGTGRVRIGDTEWLARIDDEQMVGAGQAVRVVGTKGTELRVKPV